MYPRTPICFTPSKTFHNHHTQKLCRLAGQLTLATAISLALPACESSRPNADNHADDTNTVEQQPSPQSSPTPAPTPTPVSEPQTLNIQWAIAPEWQERFPEGIWTLNQPDTNLLLSGQYLADIPVITTLPEGINPELPLELTIQSGEWLLKRLTDKVSLLEKAAVQRQASELSQNSDVVTPLITLSPHSTVQFGIIDQNGDGSLSEEERSQQHSRLDSIDDGVRVETLTALTALYITEGDVEGTQAVTNYALTQRLINDEHLTTLVRSQNSQAIRDVIAQLFPEHPTPEKFTESANEETQDFFRIAIDGTLLANQTTDYSETPWQCIDDLRVRKSPYRKVGYGIHLWHFPVQPSSENIAESQPKIEKILERLNTERMCGNADWGLPTLTELEFLFVDNTAIADSAIENTETSPAKQLAFPITFPFLTGRYVYINLDDQRETLDPAIYDIQLGRVVSDDEQAQISDSNVQTLFKSWTKLNKPFVSPPEEPTREEIQIITREIKALYSSSDPSTWPAPTIDQGIDWQPLGLLPELEISAEDTPERIALGERLFFETRLSEDRNISCASCHIPSQGWEDNLRVAVGDDGQQGSRNTPSLLNMAYQHEFFWDGRSPTLEDQALKPIANPIEMNLPMEQLEERIEQGEFDDYQPFVKSAFDDKQLTREYIAQALGAFQRTLIANNTPFDQFLRGERNLSTNALWGLHLFRTKARCMNCHFGPNFTSNGYEDLGLSDYNRRNQDLGRYNTTSNPKDVGRFKVSSLRELSHTAPYMHTGRFDLDEAIVAYNNAMGVGVVPIKIKMGADRYDPLFPQGSEKLHVLDLTDAEIEALEDFILTLSSDEEDLPPVFTPTPQEPAQ